MATVWESYPNERIDLDNRAWFEGLLERELRVNRCEDCGHWHHPPRPVCPRCWSFAITATRVRGTGVVQLAMNLQQGPMGVEGVEYPYPVVAVGLDEQENLRLTATLLDAPPPAEAIGTRVEVEWTERDGAPWPAFRAVGEADGGEDG